MISLGFELPPPPPSKEEIRAWRKWRKEMNRIEEYLLKRKATPLKPRAALRKKKTILSKPKHGL